MEKMSIRELIPVKEEIHEVIVKTRLNEQSVWKDQADASFQMIQ